MITSALLAFALAAAPGCPGALAEARSIEEPRALAAAASGLLSRLERRGAGGPTEAVHRAARALSTASEAEGTDPGALARAFRAALARHCALAALPVPPAASAGDRAALQQILARPEFARARGDPLALRRMLLSAWSWVLEQLGSAQAERWASLGRALFLAAAVAAAGLGVAAWLRRRRGRAAVDTAPGPPARSGPAAPSDGSLPLAEAALARGDATGAVRHALLAALAALEGAGRVPRGRARTNAELVRGLLASGPPAAALAVDLGALARAFDGAVYGGRPATLAAAGEALAGARRISARARGAG